MALLVIQIGGTFTAPTYIYKSYKAISNPDNIECSSGVLKTAMYDPEEDQTVVLYQFQNKFPIVCVFTGIVSATGEQSV